MDARTVAGWETSRGRAALDLLGLLRHPARRTRALAARRLGLSSSSATEIVAQLRDLRLLAETPAPRLGRGRPTTMLQAHADGPLAAVVDIRHHDWRLAIAPLDAHLWIAHTRRHAGHRAEAVLADIAAAMRGLLETYGHRLRIVAVAVAGTLRQDRVVQSATLGWRNVDLAPIVRETGLPILVGNDATLAGLAEARELELAEPRVVLYLTIEVGVGGVLVVQGAPVLGSTGAGGEFGHMPFGTPGVPCPCGARGCWDNDVDGRGMARRLGERTPADPRLYAQRLIARASVDSRVRSAVEACAAAFGAGTAALVNALDPSIVIVGGIGTSLASAAEPVFSRAYRGGLMRYRRASSAPVRHGRHPDDGALRGAAEIAFDAMLQPAPLARWAELQLSTKRMRLPRLQVSPKLVQPAHPSPVSATNT